MRAYIDYQNILSFFGSNNNPLFGDCLRMLKSQCDLYFNFPKEVLLQDQDLQAIFVQLTSGSKNAPKPRFLDTSFPSRPLKSNAQNELMSREELTAVYLLDDDKVQNFKDKGGIIVAGKGQEVDTLSLLFFDDYQFSKSYAPKKEMPTWQALEPTVRPCTDIIITDRYLFSSTELLDYNIHSYLSVLGGKYHNKKVNVVIFTCLSQSFKGEDGKTHTFIPDWEKLKTELKSNLKGALGSSPNVTIVALRKVEEHDRTIFTNYNNSYSGDSLIYYDSNWNYISNGRHYTIHSHGLRENLSRGFYFIDNMQSILSGLTSARDKECIYGDKKSNFLKFPD